MRSLEKILHLLITTGFAAYLTYGSFLSGGTAYLGNNFPLLFLPLALLFFASACRLFWVWSITPNPDYEDL